MISKILAGLLALSLINPFTSFKETSSRDVYCSATATFMDGNNTTREETGTFYSFEEYLAFAANKELDKCLSFTVNVYAENAKVILRSAETYNVHGNGHYISFVDTNGSQLKDVNLNNPSTKYLRIDGANIDPNHIFNVGEYCELNMYEVTMDGLDREYDQDVFNLHDSGKIYLEYTHIQNFKLVDNTEIIDFVDSQARVFEYTQLIGGSDAVFSNIKSEDNGIIRIAFQNDIINNIKFRNCFSEEDGGAIYITGGKIEQCAFTDCDSDGDGGAIYGVTYTDRSMYINSNTFTSCYSNGDGGAVAISGDGNDRLNMSHNYFSDNYAEDDGGALYIDCVGSDIDSLEFDGNSCGGDGGALYINQEENVVKNSMFKRNRSEVDGGAICIDDDSAYIYKCVFENNHAKDDGGAIYVTVGTDDAVISNCTFRGNHADDDCDDVDGRSDTLITNSGSTIASGNWMVIVIIGEAIVAVLIILIILKKKKAN